MDEVPEEIAGEVKSLRLLRVLVTVLLVVMIGGFLFLIVLFATRLSGPERSLVLPEAIRLEAGQKAVAFTQGTDWIAVVTAGDEIVIFDRETGERRQTVRIETGE